MDRAVRNGLFLRATRPLIESRSSTESAHLRKDPLKFSLRCARASSSRSWVSRCDHHSSLRLFAPLHVSAITLSANLKPDACQQPDAQLAITSVLFFYCR